MNSYQRIDLIVAAFALVISTIAFVMSHRQRSRLNKLVEQLSLKQLQIIESDEVERKRARIVAKLERRNSDWRFIVSNEGPSVARKINFLLVDCPDSPLMNDYSDKFPMELLQPGQSVELHAAIAMGAPSKYRAKVRWINADGSEEEAEYFLTL